VEERSYYKLNAGKKNFNMSISVSWMPFTGKKHKQELEVNILAILHNWNIGHNTTLTKIQANQDFTRCNMIQKGRWTWRVRRAFAHNRSHEFKLLNQCIMRNFFPYRSYTSLFIQNELDQNMLLQQLAYATMRTKFANQNYFSKMQTPNQLPKIGFPWVATDFDEFL